MDNITMACDLDGYLCSDSDTSLDKFMFKFFPDKWANFRYKHKERIKKAIVGEYIITGRPLQDVKVTSKWLKKNNITVPIYYLEDFFPNESKVIAHKVSKIIYLDVDVYIESDKNQAKKIVDKLIKRGKKYEIIGSSVIWRIR